MSQLPPPPPADATPGTTSPPAVAPADTAEHPAPATTPAVPATRTGAVWWALGFSMLLLVLVLVFVLQNLSTARTSFFVAKWNIPLGLDLLLSALLGAVITFLLGASRMFQLRRVARRYARNRRP